ncbi:MAG: hypothetical protein ACK2U6_11705 [Candidatus Promineifilaceae bacterium]|jgi:hypothetical protein
MGISGQTTDRAYFKGRRSKPGERIYSFDSPSDEVIIMEYVPYYHQRERLD